MSMFYRLSSPFGCGLIFALFFSLSGCANVPAEQRIDNLPMYGQPNIPRPDNFKKADEDFIKQAASGFGGSREVASKAWSAEADKFMREDNLDYAMRRYNQSWLLDPNNYLPYWGFGRVMLERKKYKEDEAIVYFEKAIKLCVDAHQKVGLLSDTGTAYSYRAAGIPENKPEERARYFNLANQRFVESTTLNPKYGNAWLRWSHSLYREGKYEDAWNKLKTARSLGVNATEVYLKNISEKMPEPK